ncbi:MAG: c-type cytochrome [Rhodobacteraceae bacterium]|nr:c-type cytochrome [Paracoccaceae bacterium]
MIARRLFRAAAVFLMFGAAPLAAQEFFTLKGHGGPIKGIATAADGGILTASFDNSVGLWHDGTPRWFEGHLAAVNAVTFLADGLIASAGDDFSVRIWETGTGTSRELGRHEGKVIRLAASPDGRRLASASWDGTARIWTIDGSQPPLALAGHKSNVNDVAFSADGTRLFTASSDGTIREWDTTTGETLRTLVHHGFGVNTLTLDETAGWLAYGAVDGGTRIIALADVVVIGDFTLDRRPILALAYHAGAARLAVGDAHGYIMMLDTRDWKIAEDFRATLSGPIWALAFSPDGQNIHAGGLDNAMYSWPIGDLADPARMADTERDFLTPPSEMSNGERQFRRKCAICHALGPDGGRRAGPTFHGLFGRPAGSVAGYHYSDTLQNSDIVWNESTIDQLFEEGPDGFIPGSKMPMQRIVAPADRADLIDYLKQATGG